MGCLDDGEAALALDGTQPSAAVIKSAGEHDRHDLWPIDIGSRAKKHIDRRPMAVFFRTAHHMNVAFLDE
jgi:hypothetical protein